ncbi:hypothetical protein TUM4445_25120 [Shewanella sp. MBTL60-112-B2]|nr:hypothetical protein TUM4444_09480 [Shewanella sp. MBTL60-112-B1]GIU35366.1 hypothetical protein TUM4445_25120 [Shewanella sp. MBTL60-112-B2]
MSTVRQWASRGSPLFYKLFNNEFYRDNKKGAYAPFLLFELKSIAYASDLVPPTFGWDNFKMI